MCVVVRYVHAHTHAMYVYLCDGCRAVSLSHWHLQSAGSQQRFKLLPHGHVSRHITVTAQACYALVKQACEALSKEVKPVSCGVLRCATLPAALYWNWQPRCCADRR